MCALLSNPTPTALNQALLFSHLSDTLAELTDSPPASRPPPQLDAKVPCEVLMTLAEIPFGASLFNFEG